MPPSYTNQVLYAAGGNPYGTSYASGLTGDSSVSIDTLTAAHYQGHRLAQYASRLVPESSRPARPRDASAANPLDLDPYDPPHRSVLAALN